MTEKSIDPDGLNIYKRLPPAGYANAIASDPIVLKVDLLSVRGL